MHEYGIVEGLLATVDHSVSEHGGRRAVQVVVAVRGMSEAEERLLSDAFDTYKVATTAREAELVIESAPREVRCLDCGATAILPETPPKGDGSRCPRCGGGAVRPVHGQDVRLKSVEIEV